MVFGCLCMLDITLHHLVLSSTVFPFLCSSMPFISVWWLEKLPQWECLFLFIMLQIALLLLGPILFPVHDQWLVKLASMLYYNQYHLLKWQFNVTNYGQVFIWDYFTHSWYYIIWMGVSHSTIEIPLFCFVYTITPFIVEEQSGHVIHSDWKNTAIIFLACDKGQIRGTKP